MEQAIVRAPGREGSGGVTTGGVPAETARMKPTKIRRCAEWRGCEAKPQGEGGGVPDSFPCAESEGFSRRPSGG